MPISSVSPGAARRFAAFVAERATAAARYIPARSIGRSYITRRGLSKAARLRKIIDARLRDNPRYALAAGARRNSSWRSRAGCGRHGAVARAPAPGALTPAPFAIVNKPSALKYRAENRAARYSGIRLRQQGIGSPLSVSLRGKPGRTGSPHAG